MLVDDRRVQTKGNLETETVRMGLDQSALAHIMDVLTNLYSDKQLAVIREYSTNAWDSAVMAAEQQGTEPKPIEVTLPTQLNPVFTVRDHGTGLSPDDVRDTFSLYGASTKRGTNSQVGMLGLGCKSALTLTNQFLLSAVRNGVRTEATISRSADGSATIQLEVSDTDEPNGVLITVPIPNLMYFEQKARKFFSYWPSGTVLIDGRPNEFMQGDELIPGTYAVEGSGSDYVVMGNVPYPVNSNTHTNYNTHLVSIVPIGAVDFTPSREALHYTKRTTATVERINENVERAIKTKAAAEVAVATTGYEAARIIQRWNRAFRNVNLTWQGQSLPHRLNTVRYYGKDDIPIFFVETNGLTSTRSMALHAENTKGVMFVEGFDVKTLALGHRRRAAKYIADQKLDIRLIIFCDARFGGVWTEHCPTVSFSDIRKIKVPRTARAKTEQAPGYYAVNPSKSAERFTEVHEFDAKLPLVYASPAEYQPRSARDLLAGQSCTYVSIERNRWDKFKRENPRAQHLDVQLQTRVKEVIDKLTEYDRLVLTSRFTFNHLSRLDPKRVADPELARVLAAQKDGKTSPAYAEFQTLRSKVKSVPEIQPIDDAVLDRYPLLKGLGYTKQNLEHVYEYIAHFAPKEEV